MFKYFYNSELNFFVPNNVFYWAVQTDVGFMISAEPAKTGCAAIKESRQRLLCDKLTWCCCCLLWSAINIGTNTYNNPLERQEIVFIQL